MTGNRQKTPISFEFFPARTAEGSEKLNNSARELAGCNPDFFSVTYGAGGSTCDKTFESVAALREATDIPTAPHLSCIGASADELRTLLNRYQNEGIDRIVALRGDLPSGMGYQNGECVYANELVSLIRDETGDHFHIEVAAYTETHPQARSAEADLVNFKRKVDAGASSAITQYFYNPDSYFYFVDRCHKLDVNVPIIPGIMPITNYSRLARFSDGCGAEIPRWIRKQLEAYGDDSTSIRQFGEEVVTRLCERLIDEGVPGLHFYTLNQSAPTVAICRNLALA